MFPSANSTIYRNEDGEVTGWDNEDSHLDDVQHEDFYDYQDDPEDRDVEDCDHESTKQVADENGDGEWDVCLYCEAWGFWSYLNGADPVFVLRSDSHEDES